MKLEETVHPLELSDKDIERVTAVLEGNLDVSWVSTDELESYHDMLYDHVVAKIQTHEGSLTVQ